MFRAHIFEQESKGKSA